MSQQEVRKMRGVLQVREQRTLSAERALQAAREAMEASRIVRDHAAEVMRQTRQARDDEVTKIKHGMMTAGRHGDEIHAAMLYVRQLDSKTRAAEVNHTRCDGELARMQQQAEIARYAAVDMRVREEKARHMLDRSRADWARSSALLEQSRLEAAHESLSAASGRRRSSALA